MVGTHLELLALGPKLFHLRVANVGALARTRRRTINLFETWSRFVQSLAVDDQMVVVADPNMFAPESDQPFDVILVPANAPSLRLHRLNPFGLKDDHLTASRPAKVVSQPVHEQMIATDHLHLQKGFSLFQIHSVSQPGL